MPLTPEQWAELELLGPANVRTKLNDVGAGRDALVPGFKDGELLRGDIEDWLAEKYSEEAAMQRNILRWAKIAAWAGIVGVFVGAAAIAVAVRLAK